MSKLHELLAVDGNLKAQADKTRKELANTFEKKRHLFEEKLVTFTSNEEKATPVTEEQKDIQTTVKSELDWVSKFIINSLDVSYQVAEANTTARADVVLEDDTVLLKDIPATALLELEKRIKELREFLATVPTLDPAKGFKADASRGAGISVARDVTKTRTKKTKRAIVLYDATKEHPAQTAIIDEDIPVGTITEREWSGMITPAEKADMLARAEMVERAVKKARSRANDIEIDVAGKKLGAKVVKYIFGE